MPCAKGRSNPVPRGCLALVVATLLIGAFAPASLAQSGADEIPPEIVPPSRSAGATTATVVTPAKVFEGPGIGRRVWQVSTATRWSRQPMTLMVLGSQIEGSVLWLQVRLPLRSDKRRTGWIQADAVQLEHTPYWVEVIRRERRVRVFRGGEKLRSFRAVVGKRATPTPRGLEAIYERNRQPHPHGFVGSWVLALTATSPVLKSFDGGPPRIGIHGRGGASLRDPLGSARSNGCIRITNRSVSWLRHVPAGTPVLLR